MIQYGDITKLSGYDLEPVDLIVGGSPCQDLSIAGKRAGLEGERSGLFLEMIRIIREMREVTHGVYPRFALWENVPGAFSSNNGKDFGAVLGEFARLIEPKAPDVPVPENGWAYSGILLVGGGGQIAWRTHDAQFWGVPQRRRRISLVADLRGESAAEILFERKGLPGNTEQSEATRKGTAGETGGGVENASCLTNRAYYTGNIAETLRAEPHGAIPMVADFKTGKCLNPWDIQLKRIAPMDGVAGTLNAAEKRYGGSESLVFIEKDKTENKPIVMNPRPMSMVCSEDSANTLGADDYKEPQIVLEEDKKITYGVTAKGNGDVFISEEKHTSLPCGGGMSGQGYPCILSFQERSGKPGGGKGILIQEDHVGALSTLNNQMILQPNKKEDAE